MIYNQIFYILGYDYDINIGRAYNNHIQYLPDDCWICVCDADSMFVNPKFGHQLNRVINEYENDYALFGCVTNRLGYRTQLYKGAFSNDFDVRNHYQISESIKQDITVRAVSGAVINECVSGLMMLFKKSTWLSVGGFTEKGYTFDSDFNKAIRKNKLGKIGIMEGVYLFHAYRLHESDRIKARNNVTHLKVN